MTRKTKAPNLQKDQVVQLLRGLAEWHSQSGKQEECEGLQKLAALLAEQKHDLATIQLKLSRLSSKTEW
jgi:dsDNA-binding SOS-regulon protein